MSENESLHSHVICRAAFSVLALLFGIAGAVLWLTVWELDEHAYATFTFAGLSSVLSLWHAILHIMHLQDLWRTWLKGLRVFITAGIVFTVISVASFLSFIIVAAIKHEKMTASSYYVTAIWCGWNAVLSIFLHLHAKKYRSEFADLTALLEF